MNFSLAIELLNDGARIGRQPWTGKMFLQVNEGNPRAYLHATSNFQLNMTMFTSSDWIINFDDTCTVTFAEAVEALRKGFKVSLPEWKEQHLEYDKHARAIVLKHLVFHDWQPTFEDLCAEDWEKF